jgi:hypothetical protein
VSAIPLELHQNPRNQPPGTNPLPAVRLLEQKCEGIVKSCFEINHEYDVFNSFLLSAASLPASPPPNAVVVARTESLRQTASRRCHRQRRRCGSGRTCTSTTIHQQFVLRKEAIGATLGSGSSCRSFADSFVLFGGDGGGDNLPGPFESEPSK